MVEIRTMLTSVVAVRDVHPQLRSVTFGGGDLVDFEPCGPDTFLYLLVAQPGRDLTIDQSFTWEAHRDMPDDEKPVGGYYTLRRWDPVASELEVWMVLHDDPGDADGHGGHALRWAREVLPGAQVALWGPRTAFHPPPDTEHYVLVGDETGLPAIAVILEQLPPQATATVIAEVADLGSRQPLPEGFDVRWLYRDGAPYGDAARVAEAVAALPRPRARTYVWGGGESHLMTAARKVARREWGLERDDVSLVAYWRYGPAEPPDPDDT